ncbi:MAG: tetratricopeptide repeat protein, partial [Bdellovibrio sp.]|nr:tetratricopeptide repeat protein [Bdellovibrio sp.]
LKAFLQAAVLDPTDGEALFQAGKLYLETSRYDDAIKQFKRVQRLNANYPRTWYYVGKASFAAGDLNGAAEAAKQEKRQNPNMADSYILAAEIYTARKQFTECAGEYSQAMKLRPQGADIYVKAAQCYRQSASLEVAEDMLALAAARESGYAEIYREQGAIYEMKGDIRSAAQAYNKYLGLSPNAPDRAEIENKILRLGN